MSDGIIGLTEDHTDRWNFGCLCSICLLWAIPDRKADGSSDATVIFHVFSFSIVKFKSKVQVEILVGPN